MFQKYYNQIAIQYKSHLDNTEGTYRTAFENLLNQFEKATIKRDLVIKHEPSQQKNSGRPDFKVTTNYALTIGLIETKKIGENLDEILNSKQLARYQLLSDNIILTDYLKFYLIKNGDVVSYSEIFSRFDLEKKKFKVADTRIIELTEIFKLYFESEPETITKTDDLAVKLSDKAKFLREFSQIELEKPDNDGSVLLALYKGFQESLLPNLDKVYFADIYAQTLTYGLFIAALNTNDPRKELNKITAYTKLPNTFSLIQELFHSLDRFPEEIVWAIDEIITILKVVDYLEIKKEFAEYRNKEKGFSDPFIYFYEDFLKNYDKTQRELRGVYYTPEPVVSFITRSIDKILKDKFNIYDGFINEKVTLLDFATGTGTFLLNAFNLGLEEGRKIYKNDIHTLNKLLNEVLIKNYNGFELLVAPYVIAHLKISEFFKEQGLSIDKDKRLNIFLTNTLTNKEPQSFPMMPNLSKEGREANRIKNQDILVIFGNPPYSVSSSNKTGFIADEKMNRYKLAIKEEKNIQPLSDDYIKFIRFAQWKLENVERGVIGVITNNSFIDGIIHRGMREELLKDFDEIYILNLHGNSRINEKSPDGSKDENVFSIMQGVAITLFIKNQKETKPFQLSKTKSEPKVKEPCKVFYQDLWGKQKSKFDYLFANDINTTNWQELTLENKYFFFKPKNFSNAKEYNKGWKVSDMFQLYSSGIKTHRDNFLISYKKEELNNRINNLFSKNNLSIVEQFQLQNTRDWKIELAIKNNKFEINNLQKYNYRPFSMPIIYYDTRLIDSGTSRIKVMQHFLENDNLGLNFSRKVNSIIWNSVFISELLTDIHFIGDQSYMAPLYTYNTNGETDENGNGFLFKEEGKKDNFTKDFRAFIKQKYSKKFTPEEVLGYIYAVLHSPNYREKYLEFLKIDFPRIPFVDDINIFEKLSKIGTELISHHLLKEDYKSNLAIFSGEGENYKVETVKVEKIVSNKTIKVAINKVRYFENIPEEIWDFYIGGYQVLDKWLKERKKHKLSLELADINHFQKVVNSLNSTITLMKVIDTIIEI